VADCSIPPVDGHSAPPCGLRNQRDRIPVEGLDARGAFERENGAESRLVIHQGEGQMAALREAAAPAS
jgi:hypothetical protein